MRDARVGINKRREVDKYRLNDTVSSDDNREQNPEIESANRK